MILSVSSQVYVFLLCVSIGLLAGLFYDFFKIIRASFEHKNFFVQVEDLIYWLIITFLSFLILLHKNNGEIRLYGFIGLVFGYIVNEILISKLTVKIGVKIILYIKIFIRQLFYVVFFPLRIIFKPTKFFYKKSQKLLKKNKNKLKSKVGTVKRNLRIMKEKI